MRPSPGDLFSALLDVSTDNIFLIDRDGRYRYVSTGGARNIGKTPAEVIGHTWRDLGLPADIMTEVEAQWSRVFATSETLRHVVTYLGRTYEYSMFPLLEFVAVMSRDITVHHTIERELRLSTERYRNFVANSSEAIWRFELDAPIDVTTPVEEQIEQQFDRGYLAECNDAMARMYGFERAEDVIGTRLPQMLDRSQEHNRAFLRAFVENKYRLVDAESIETDRYGNRKYFLNSFTGEVVDGKLMRAWGTQHDMTQEKLALENLRSSEQRLQALVAATMQIVWSAGAGGAVEWVGGSWTDVTGQPPEAAMGAGWVEFLHPEDRAEAQRLWETARSTKTPLDYSARIRAGDGTYRWFHVRSAPVFNPDGSVREWVGACRDVEAEKRQVDLSTAERRRAEFIADANDLFVRSLDYEQTLRNLVRMAVPRLADWAAVDMIEGDGSFRRLAVEHPDPEMKKLAYELEARYPADPNSPYGLHEIARTGKTQWMAEIPESLLAASAVSPEHLALIRKLRLRSYVAAPIYVRDRVAGVLTLVDSKRSYTEADVSLAEDLALRAGHAIENARLYEQAVQANRTKDEFLATLSHELRTPLTAILGWANLLHISNYDPATIRQAIDTIEQSARAQATLIDDLLDISRIVTGKLELHIGPIDIVHVVQTGIGAVRPAATAKHITIRTDLPEQLTIRGDANRLQQVVWNLMSNAVKFSGESSPIEVSVTREDEHAVIRVTDHGIGIESELLPHVFERFWQADSSIGRVHGGLGLGLAIVKYLAELHGGTVSATSAGAGQGATFTVMLPVGEVGQAEASPQRVDEARRASVLVVDDDPSTREILARTLEHFGAQVTLAPAAADALGLIAHHSYDLVLTDIAMPENDGYWLLREIRKTNPRLRVAAITALGHSNEEIASAGFDAYLRKPMDPERLQELLNRFA